MTLLTVFEGVEYRYWLGPAVVKREITYREARNIKERKIELVKAEEEYYVKCLLVRESACERAHLHFELNGRNFLVAVVADRLFAVLDYGAYFKARERKAQLPNKLVRIASRTLLCFRESTRVVKYSRRHAGTS